MSNKKMNARTEGLKNFVKLALDLVQAKDLEGAELLLVDLLNDIGGAYVCKEPTIHINNIYQYDPASDGDYSTWLSLHNID